MLRTGSSRSEIIGLELLAVKCEQRKTFVPRAPLSSTPGRQRAEGQLLPNVGRMFMRHEADFHMRHMAAPGK